MHVHSSSFKAGVLILCIVKLCIRIDCPIIALYCDSILSDTVSLNLDMFCVATAGSSFFIVQIGSFWKSPQSAYVSEVPSTTVIVGANIRNFILVYLLRHKYGIRDYNSTYSQALKAIILWLLKSAKTSSAMIKWVIRVHQRLSGVIILTRMCGAESYNN